MRLNALSPSENPMEQLLYCFGGPGDGGNGDSSSTAASEDIGTKDVDKGPSKSAPSGGDQQDRQAYSDRFGGVSTRNFNVDTSQGFVDTDQGRVYGSSDVLGKGIAEGDITPSESQQAALDAAGGIATDMGIDPSNIAVGGDLFFGEEDVMANQDLSFGSGAAGPTLGGSAGDFEGVSFTPTAVTQTVRGPAPGPAALSPEQEARLTAMLAAEGVALPGPTTAAQAEGRQQARDAYRAGMGEGLIEDLDVFDVDALGPVDLDEVPAGALPAGTPAGSPMQQITEMATRPGYTPSSPSQRKGSNALFEEPMPSGVPREMRTPADIVDMSPQQGRVVSETVLGEPRTAALGPRDMQIVSDILDQAVPGRVATGARAEPVFGGDLFMDQAVPVSRATPTSVDVSGYQPTDYGREDLAKAEADLAAARAEAYADKQFGFDTGLPTSIDVFGVNVPTSIGVVEGIADALFDPEAALANQIAERGIKSLDGASAEGSANYNPQGLEVVTSGGPLSEGGRTVAYDARGNVVYDSRGIGSQMGDFLTGNRPPENIQALYDRQRAIEDQQREMQGGGDGGGQQVIPPPEEVVVPPEEYQGQPISGEYAYQPMGPISYAYTGLPSLAPQVLRPSFQARGQYAPLFPMGNLRRS